MATSTILMVGVLVAIKYVINANNWDFITFNPLVTTLIASTTFIVGFLLAGIIADFKEAERMPAEMVNNLENIWEEAKLFKKRAKDFNLKTVQATLIELIDTLRDNLHVKHTRPNLTPSILILNKLSESYYEMESLGITANYLVRLKQEQGNVRRLLNRIFYIQRTQFIPSAYILVESITAIILVAFLFLESEATVAQFLVYAFIAYIFIYINRLIRIIENPFKEGVHSLDDVSMFLFKDFKERLKKEIVR